MCSVGHVSERVVKNRPGLPWHALRLGALGHQPLVAGSVDADGVGRKAVKVRDSPGIGLREDVFRDVLTRSPKAVVVVGETGEPLPSC
jgi:hypothetical protein